MRPCAELITIQVPVDETLQGTMKIDAVLIREASPRLAVAQDRVVQLTDDNIVIANVDLLTLFKEEG